MIPNDPLAPVPAGAVAAPPPAAPPTPWGSWATIGFLLLILGGMMVGQMAVLVPWVVVRMVRDPGADINELAETLQYDGDLLAVATFAGAIVTLGLVILLVKARRISPRDYLALGRVRLKIVLPWALALLVFVVAFDSLSTLLDRPVVPESMRRVYETAAFLPLLWIAVVIVAPLWEEIVFRGFGFPGLRSSRLGMAGAIIVPALFWTALHVQYDAYDLGFVFLLGLLFGYARERTGSVTVPIVLHVLNNLIATVQMGLLT